MANSKSWLRFGIGNLLVLVALIAVALGWWRDHRRLSSQIELLHLRVEALQPRSGGGGMFGGVAVELRHFLSAGELVDVVEAVSDGKVVSNSNLVAAILASYHLVEAIPGLVKLLEHKDPAVRRQAAEILGRMNRPPELVVSALIERLDDQDVVVQRWAMEGVGRLRAKSALPALQRKMLDDDCKAATYAATMITAIDSKTDIGPRLIQLTRNKHRDNRWLAVFELPSFVDAVTAEKVLTGAFAATDPSDKEMRQTIAESINRLILPGKK